MQTGMAAQQPPVVVTRDQQEVLMEAMREQKQQTEIAMPPLPPTSLTPLIEAANQEAAARGPGANPAGPPTGFAPPAPPVPGRLY
jgi:hypothetical protein